MLAKPRNKRYNLGLSRYIPIVDYITNEIAKTPAIDNTWIFCTDNKAGICNDYDSFLSTIFFNGNLLDLSIYIEGSIRHYIYLVVLRSI